MRSVATTGKATAKMPRKLARFARLDPNVLRPITHRSVALQESLTLVRARDVLVRARASLVNAARGLVKPCGFRLPNCSTKSFHKRCLALLPDGLKRTLKPLIDQGAQMSEQIQIFDKERLRGWRTRPFPKPNLLCKYSESAHLRRSLSC